LNRPLERDGILFVISAPSGAGKTSMCRQIVDIFPDLRHSVSFTTRTPRPGEVHGRDYFFISKDAFMAMAAAGEFAEWAEVHGNCYGTALATIDEYGRQGIDVVLDIDCQGARQLKKKYDGGVFIFILPPHFDELRRRLDNRSSDLPEVIEERLRNATGEISECHWYDYIIVNDKFERAVDDLRGIVLAERCRTIRLRAAVEQRYDICAG
jgi:guanylate kinase